MGTGRGSTCGLTSISSPIGKVRYAAEGAPASEPCPVLQSTSAGRPLATTDSSGRGRHALSAPGSGDGAWTAQGDAGAS
eukprot:117897-Prymnesium_polylepis.2